MAECRRESRRRNGAPLPAADAELFQVRHGGVNVLRCTGKMQQRRAFRQMD
jgi:hypothetical protein